MTAADADSLPIVLILAGVAQGWAGACLTYLCGTTDGQRRASHVRICDKFLIVPKDDVFLRYVEPSARKALKEGHGVEYVQTNLSNAQARAKAFVPPSTSSKKAYDVVLDFQFMPSDTTYAASGDEVMMEQITKNMRAAGLEAIKNGGVGCYISVVDPYITQSRKQCPMKEADADWKATNNWTKWVYEGARCLAAISELNLVVARIANPWGPGTPLGFNRRLAIASVYQYLNGREKMEFLWGKDLVLEHLHLEDTASALWALAEWQRKTAKSRARAADLAKAPLPPCRPCASDTSSKLDSVEIPDLPKRQETLFAPMFNLSDGSGQTQGELGKVLEQVMGIKVDFHSSITNALAKLNMSEVVEIAEEKHNEPWQEMLVNSTPPISDTPVSVVLSDLALRKHRSHLDNTKIRTLTGWQPKYPRVTAEEVQRTIDVFKADHLWPNAAPLGKS